jgi:hypothetical protein
MRAILTSRRLAIAAIAVVTSACGTSSSAGSSDGDGPNDASSATCASVAATLCTRAAACGSGGSAPVLEPGGVLSIDYESVAFCEMTFTTQCGPSAPSSDYPLVKDPSACAEALGATSCMMGALLLPEACQ